MNSFDFTFKIIFINLWNGKSNLLNCDIGIFSKIISLFSYDKGNKLVQMLEPNARIYRWTSLKGGGVTRTYYSSFLRMRSQNWIATGCLPIALFSRSQSRFVLLQRCFFAISSLTITFRTYLLMFIFSKNVFENEKFYLYQKLRVKEKRRVGCSFHLLQ